MADLLPLHDRAQHRGDRRAQAVSPRRRIPVAAAGSPREISVIGLDSGDIARWTASHDGYLILKPPRRTAARFAWSAGLARSKSPTRFLAEITIFALRFTWGRTYRPGYRARSRRYVARSVRGGDGGARASRRAELEPAPRRSRANRRLVFEWAWTSRSFFYIPWTRPLRI